MRDKNDAPAAKAAEPKVEEPKPKAEDAPKREAPAKKADRAEEEDPGATIVMPEAPFGAEPADFEGADPVVLAQSANARVRSAAESPPLAAADFPPDESGKAVAYTGPDAAVTLIVPEGKDAEYDGLITEGTTYTLPRGVAKFVKKEHVGWLTKHPTYDIEEVKGE